MLPGRSLAWKKDKKWEESPRRDFLSLYKRMTNLRNEILTYMFVWWSIDMSKAEFVTLLEHKSSVGMSCFSLLCRVT